MGSQPTDADVRVRRTLVAALVALSTWAALAHPLEAAAPPPAGQPGEKRIAFSMDDTAWRDVFRWVREKTGKPVIFTIKPSGTFSCVSPPGATYTVAEAIDIINDALMLRKFYLLERPRNYIVVPIDDRDPKARRHFQPDELDERHLGRNEIVSVIFTLKNVVPSEIADEVAMMMGPFKEVVPLDKSGQLYLQDTVSTLRRIRKAIDALDRKAARRAKPTPGAAGAGVLKRHDVTAGTAEPVAKLLRPKFPGATIRTVRDHVLLVYAPPSDQLRIAEAIRKEEEKAPRTVILSVGDSDPEKIAMWVMRTFISNREKTDGLSVEPLNDKGAISVRGTPAQIKIVKELLR
jgi:type II secretory pathway component GspD/PulD (secretin)